MEARARNNVENTHRAWESLRPPQELNVSFFFFMWTKMCLSNRQWKKKKKSYAEMIRVWEINMDTHRYVLTMVINNTDIWFVGIHCAGFGWCFGTVHTVFGPELSITQLSCRNTIKKWWNTLQNMCDCSVSDPLALHSRRSLFWQLHSSTDEHKVN